MNTKLKCISKLIVILLISGSTYSQTISRSVICSSGESYRLTRGNNLRFDMGSDRDDDVHTKFSLSYTLGEDVAGLLSRTDDYALTTGFEQPESTDHIEFNKEESRTLVVFPNPVSGSTLKINLNHVPDGNYQLDISNTLGMHVHSEKIYCAFGKLQFIMLDVTQLRPGTYFLKLQNQIYQGEARFIKF